MSDREKMADEIRAQMFDALAKVREQHRVELLAAEASAYNQGRAHGKLEGFEIGVLQGESWRKAQTELDRAIAELKNGEGEDGQ